MVPCTLDLQQRSSRFGDNRPRGPPAQNIRCRKYSTRRGDRGKPARGLSTPGAFRARARQRAAFRKKLIHCQCAFQPGFDRLKRFARIIVLLSALPPRYIAAISIAYRPQLSGLTRKLGAGKAMRYAFLIGAGGDLAHAILAGPASFLAVGRLALNHAGADLAGYAADPHLKQLFRGHSPPLRPCRLPTLCKSFPSFPPPDPAVTPKAWAAFSPAAPAEAWC